MRNRFLSCCGLATIFSSCLALAAPAADGVQVLDAKMHHLRSGTTREWDGFPEKAEGPQLAVHFTSSRNTAEQALRLRHRDLKQNWVIRLNGKELAKLPPDENEMTTLWPVPAGALRDGDNELVIACSGGPSDDVMVGEIALLHASRKQALSEASVDVTVVAEADREYAPTTTPCRLTLADERGGLVSFEATSSSPLAVRPGVAYSTGGQAHLSLPAGRYTLYAGRGFAYSLDSCQLDLRIGDSVQKRLSIRKVVNPIGYVACDTHVHTWTYSRHGDATIEERLITLAGEGIELPIATDHNLQIDYAAAGLPGNAFTPVIGNEVTTATLGHFNVFPIDKSAKLIDWRVHDWAGLSRNIHVVAEDPVIILNHARDTHGNFRPFDPSRHISFTGEELDRQEVPANAMEVINSGSTQTDSMQLCRDWFGMLNRGHRMTPIGSSDSHDVSRYIVGQARTYVKCAATNPGEIDVGQAVASLHAGRVIVSYGLLARIEVQHDYGAGDLVPTAAIPESGLNVLISVYGPAWTHATHVTLFANGVPIRDEDISGTQPSNLTQQAGLQWLGNWKLSRPRHDVYLVAVATGPGIDKPYWPCAKPYQPMSPHWESHVMAVTGAVYVNTDGTGQFKSAYDQARAVVDACHGNMAAVIAKLVDYDEAVAGQAASILRQAMPDGFDEKAKAALSVAAPAVRAGFERFMKEWAESVAARHDR